MLINLHVKNIALIREADIDLKEGLNIFTGETGAGKSLLLGSVNLALGARPKPGILRHDADSALVELTFSVENDRTKMMLEEEGVEVPDGLLVISRKITGSKSLFRINGEGTTAAQIKRIAASLLDIHGQHDHQSLLYHERQLDILDEYAGRHLLGMKEELKGVWKEYTELVKAHSEYDLDERTRLREKELIEHELEEIRSADVKEGEEEQLLSDFKKLDNAKTILSSLNSVHAAVGYEGGAADLIGRSLQELNSVREFDPELSEIADMLTDADALLSDIVRSVGDYASDFTFSEEDLHACTQRLDVIRHLESKYGSTPAKIREYEKELEDRLDFMDHYDRNKEALEKKIADVREKLEKQAEELSIERRKYAKTLSAEIVKELEDLNFSGVRFTISFSEKEEITADGKDTTEFMISVNPGEPVLPLAKIASGGELSRIMLAIKTILSRNDPVETLVFDEIDTGISGKTAVFVAEKLSRISAAHQVLCITHLAQIAAAADAHFAITKTVKENETFTDIRELKEEASEEELARLLGGSVITRTVLENARELKTMTMRKKRTQQSL